MKELGRYDTDLQMFVAKGPLEPRINHLRDLRQRAEKGEFGPKPVSVPKGENIFKLTDAEIRRYAMMEADQELKFAPPALPEHIAKTGDY